MILFDSLQVSGDLLSFQTQELRRKKRHHSNGDDVCERDGSQLSMLGAGTVQIK